MKDLQKAIKKLPFKTGTIDVENITVEALESLIKGIEKGTETWLQMQIIDSEKLYLLHGRVEPNTDRPSSQKTLMLRHYLTNVPTRNHRDTLTSILLSTHLLAIERM